MRFMLKRLFAGLALFTCLGTQATLINVVDFTGNNQGVQDSFRFEEAGVELTVSAWVGNVNSDQDLLLPFSQVTGFDIISADPLGVYKGSTGLGVRSNGDDGYDLDGGSSNEFDDLDEALLFEFSETVNFLGFAAGDLSDNDDLNLSIVNFISDTEFELQNVFIDRQATTADVDIFDVFPGILGEKFLVWVDGKDDDVRVVDTAFIKVPEPSALAIFALALLLLSFKGRRS